MTTTHRLTRKELLAYKAAHHQVNRFRGKPNKCEHCGTTTAKRYDWASKTKDYTNPQDYIRLCKSCHLKFDGVNHQLDGYREKYRLGKVIHKCPCGERFKAGSHNHLFCSNKCYRKYLNDERRAVYIPITRGFTVTCAFKDCGRLFKQNKNFQKFCSYTCQQKQLIQSRREKRSV